MEKVKKEVKHGKRNLGIFLLILQLLAFFGAYSSNSFPTNLPGWFGFCCFGIIGILLIIQDK